MLLFCSFHRFWYAHAHNVLAHCSARGSLEAFGCTWSLRNSFNTIKHPLSNIGRHDSVCTTKVNFILLLMCKNLDNLFQGKWILLQHSLNRTTNISRKISDNIEYLFRYVQSLPRDTHGDTCFLIYVDYRMALIKDEIIESAHAVACAESSYPKSAIFETKKYLIAREKI